MTLFFYNLALLAALVAGAPWWLWRMATTHKYREGLLERLGWVRLAKGLDDRPLIWAHAVSVGEVLAVSRLVGELDAAFPRYRLVISTTTRTGQALARERFGSESRLLLPAGPALGGAGLFECPQAPPADSGRDRVLAQPAQRLLPARDSGCGGECPHLRPLVAAVPAAARALAAACLSRLSRVLAQSETDAERLKAIGCLPERVTVAGNLKFDVRAAWEAEATVQLKALAADLRLVVAGSTLEGEEAALVDAWPRLLEADPQLAMVLAPAASGAIRGGGRAVLDPVFPSAAVRSGAQAGAFRPSPRKALRPLLRKALPPSPRRALLQRQAWLQPCPEPIESG